MIGCIGAAYRGWADPFNNKIDNGRAVMSRLRIALAVVYGCLFGCAFLIGVAAMKAPGGSTGFAWVALMGMPWSLLIMLLPRPPSSTTIALAQVWLLVFCPLINISLLLGLHRLVGARRSKS